MRPDIWATASRLDCCNDYASRDDARTRRKRLRPWSVSRFPALSPIKPPSFFGSFSRSGRGKNQRYRRMAPMTGILLPLRRNRDSQSRPLPPKWPPRGRTALRNQATTTGIAGRQVEQGDNGHDGSAEFRGYAARFRRSRRCIGRGARATAQGKRQGTAQVDRGKDVCRRSG